MVVVVLAWFTICNTAAAVLAVKFVSPPYEAVMLCGLPDATNALVVNVA